MRLVLAAAKALVVAGAGVASQPQLRRRGGLLSALDYCAAAVRAVLPAPLWVGYFRAAGLGGAIALALSGLYLLVKAANVLERMTLAGLAVKQWQGAVHGAPPTPAELAAAPAECSICQDELSAPQKLSCGHLFCSQCIGEWLDREATCPMCRAVVRRPGLRARSNGATAVFPIVC